jgi:hypothetical protein
VCAEVRGVRQGCVGGQVWCRSAAGGVAGHGRLTVQREVNLRGCDAGGVADRGARLDERLTVKGRRTGAVGGRDGEADVGQGVPERVMGGAGRTGEVERSAQEVGSVVQGGAFEDAVGQCDVRADRVTVRAGVVVEDAGDLEQVGGNAGGQGGVVWRGIMRASRPDGTERSLKFGNYSKSSRAASPADDQPPGRSG